MLWVAAVLKGAVTKSHAAATAHKGNQAFIFSVFLIFAVTAVKIRTHSFQLVMRCMLTVEEYSLWLQSALIYNPCGWLETPTN